MAARREDQRRASLGRLVGRSLMVVAVVGSALFGCGGGPSQPQVVSLAELVAEQDAHDGSTVIAEGVVQTFDEPRHYWIEDAEQHRVELFPPELVEDLVGLRIRVTGRFTFQDDRGRGIDVDELEVVDEPPSAAPARPTDRARPGGSTGGMQ
jgi:hypothetical protein